MTDPRFVRLWGRPISIPPAADPDLSRRVAEYLHGVERRIGELPVAPFLSKQEFRSAE